MQQQRPIKSGHTKVQHHDFDFIQLFFLFPLSLFLSLSLSCVFFLSPLSPSLSLDPEVMAIFSALVVLLHQQQFSFYGTKEKSMLTPASRVTRKLRTATKNTESRKFQSQEPPLFPTNNLCVFASGSRKKKIHRKFPYPASHEIIV